MLVAAAVLADTVLPQSPSGIIGWAVAIAFLLATFTSRLLDRGDKTRRNTIGDLQASLEAMDTRVDTLDKELKETTERALHAEEQLGALAKVGITPELALGIPSRQHQIIGMLDEYRARFESSLEDAADERRQLIAAFQGLAEKLTEAIQASTQQPKARAPRSRKSAS